MLGGGGGRSRGHDLRVTLLGVKTYKMIWDIMEIPSNFHRKELLQVHSFSNARAAVLSVVHGQPIRVFLGDKRGLRNLCVLVDGRCAGGTRLCEADMERIYGRQET